MEESNIWVISVIALAVGGLIGYLMGRSGNANNAEQEAELAAAKKELQSYKEQVAHHFEDTANLVNKMTESYRDVFQHLSSSAQQLCDEKTAQSIEATMVPQLTKEKPVSAGEETTEADVEAPVTSMEPPRDYAPKKPNEEGTLSETYSVNTDTQEAPAPSEEAKESADKQEDEKAK